MRRRFLALAAALPVLLVGCSAPSHHSSDPPSSVSPTSGPNPDVVPTVITPAYVNAVFAVLDQIRGDASRTLLVAGGVTSAVRTDLRAVYDDPLYGQELTIEAQSLTEDLSNVRRPPGNVVTSVEALLSASASCVFAETRADYTKVLKEPGRPPASAYIALRRKQPIDDPQGLNTTPWVISFNAVYQVPTSVPNQCSAS